MSSFETLKAATEALPLGESLCLFRNDNHALGLLNRTAWEVWRAKSLGQPDDVIANNLCERYSIDRQTARSDIAALLNNWHDSGLTAPIKLARTNTSNQPQHHTVPPAHQACPLDAFYGQASFEQASGSQSPLRIQCHEPVLAGLLAAVLRPLEREQRELTDAMRQASRMMEIGYHDQAAEDDGYWLRQRDGTVFDDLDRSTARRMVLSEVLLQRHGGGTTTAILHASAVELAGKIIVLAGASGAGKTTLTASLIAAGANYFGDDLLALLPCGRKIGDFPTCLALKQGSWPLATTLFRAFDDCETLTTRKIKVRYFNPAGNCPTPSCPTPSARQRSIALLVLPRYEPGSSFSMRRLTPEDAFNGLIASGSEPLGSPRSMRSMINLANSVPTYQMRFGSSDQAVTEIKKLRQS